MNVEKIKQLKKFILAEPRRYRQHKWFFGKNSSVVISQKPPCGTAACLAGNACLMEGYLPDNPDNFYPVIKKGLEIINVRDLAEEILGLTHDQGGQLFAGDCTGWPKKAAQMYYRARTPRGRAKAAALALDALIRAGRRR